MLVKYKSKHNQASNTITATLKTMLVKYKLMITMTI